MEGERDPQHHRGPELTPRNTRRANCNSQIFRFRFALRRDHHNNSQTSLNCPFPPALLPKSIHETPSTPLSLLGDYNPAFHPCPFLSLIRSTLVFSPTYV